MQRLQLVFRKHRQPEPPVVYVDRLYETATHILAGGQHRPEVRVIRKEPPALWREFTRAIFTQVQSTFEIAKVVERSEARSHAHYG